MLSILLLADARDGTDAGKDSGQVHCVMGNNLWRTAVFCNSPKLPCSAAELFALQAVTTQGQQLLQRSRCSVVGILEKQPESHALNASGRKRSLCFFSKGKSNLRTGAFRIHACLRRREIVLCQVFHELAEVLNRNNMVHWSRKSAGLISALNMVVINPPSEYHPRVICQQGFT